MWWQFGFVFLAAVLVDITPLPLPPAFTVMVLLQIIFNLSIWPVIVVGVAGSILGRLILTLYIPTVADRIFRQDKNEDIRFLGNKLKTRGWKGQLFILFYTLMPLPSTPLFVAGGIARMKPYFIIPAFTVGKFVSDSVAVFMGKYAAENTQTILHGLLSWKSILGVFLALLLLAALVFIDWRSLLREKKFRLRFNIWK
jgi:membrane protein YqaA with SNARE-associated domain